MSLFGRLRDRWRGVSGQTFVSFRPHLTAICRALDLQDVLEFGPGNSTMVVLAETSAKIVAVEESAEWYAKYCERFPSDRVTVHHKPAGWCLDELDVLGGPYDLIFVDGGDRTEELHYVHKLLKPTGVVYLHDAHREKYEPGIRSYPHMFFPERHSCIMTLDGGVMETLKSAITSDYSCACKYCTSDERRAYFARMSGGAC